MEQRRTRWGWRSFLTFSAHLTGLARQSWCQSTFPKEISWKARIQPTDKSHPQIRAGKRLFYCTFRGTTHQGHLRGLFSVLQIMENQNSKDSILSWSLWLLMKECMDNLVQKALMTSTAMHQNGTDMRLFVIKMSPSQRGAWLWPFLCGARAIWTHRGLWQAEVSVHGQRLVMETIWKTAANPEAKRTPVWLVLHGIHRGAQGQRPDFRRRLGQWLFNLRRCRIHEWI